MHLFTARTGEVSKSRELGSDLSHCSEIWPVPRQHCRSTISQISHDDDDNDDDDVDDDDDNDGDEDYNDYDSCCCCWWW